MDPVRFGQTVRAVRIRMRLRQRDVAARARVSVSTVSRIERGHLEPLSINKLLRVAAVLEIRVDFVPRWRGGDLGRVLAAGHSAMHEQVARLFARLPAWSFAPEVTYAVYGERGVIDVLAFHPARRALLVIELKTQLVDMQELLAQVDRYRRLAPTVARARGWRAETVGVWVAMRATMTNRRRVVEHAAVLGVKLPDRRIRQRRWLKDPIGPLAALTFLSDSHPRRTGETRRASQRVRRPTLGVAERAIGPEGDPTSVPRGLGRH